MPNSTKSDLYYEWLLKKISYSNEVTKKYSNILYLMFSTPFKYFIPLDENEAVYALDLRSKYFNETQIFPKEGKATVLEVLIELAEQIEEKLQGEDTEVSYLWFWTMAENLGIIYLSDTSFSLPVAKALLDRFVYRRYEPNGRNGNIFIISDSSTDLRKLPLWSQANVYLQEKEVLPPWTERT